MAIWVAFCPDTRAHSPPARELCGVVQEISVKSQALTIRSPERAVPVKLVWTRDTLFIQNQQFTNSTTLKTGLRVCVHYHSPFLGRPRATKVVWQTP